MEIPKSQEEYKKYYYICSSIPKKNHDLRLGSYVKNKLCPKTEIPETNICEGQYSDSPSGKMLGKVIYETHIGPSPSDSTSFKDEINLIHDFINLI